MEKLILIDGSSILYRAFFALPHFTTKTGEPTGAVYGFLQMFKKLLKDENPEYIAVAFDKKAPTLRHISFEEYKANRPKTPDELLAQFKTIREILESFGIKYFEADGYEADDIIATLVEKFNSEPLKIIVVSGDMDLLQIVADNVSLYVTKKGVTHIEAYDRNKVFDDFGVYPEQIPDLKALCGDVSDNIPGVPGVGPKTAAKILREYGSIENIIANINKMDLTNLKDYQELIAKNKSLTVLHRNVDIKADLSEIKLNDIRNEKSKEMLSKLEFKTIVKELFFENSLPHLDLQIDDKGNKCAIVFDGYKRYCYYDGESFYEFEIGEELFRNRNALDFLKEVFQNSKMEKHVNNLKILHKLENEIGSKAQNIGIDVNIAAFLLNPDEIKDGIDFFRKLFGINSALNDSKSRTVFLFNSVERIEQELRKEGLYKLYEDLEKPLTEVLVEMEQRGIKIDSIYFEGLKKEIKDELEGLESKIYSLAGISFNILSSKQLSEILFEEIGLSPTKASKTGYSTSIASLKDIEEEHPIIPLIIEYRHLSKLLSNYIEPFPKIVSKIDGRIHTTFEIIGTSTGRLRSNNPNLQNIPIKGIWGEKIRKGFIASSVSKKLIGADYSQIELRILAHFSEDPILIKAIEDGLDIHTFTASQVFKVKENDVTKEMRSKAKAINFAIIYGVTPMGLSRQLGCSFEETQMHINEYFNKYKKVKEFIEDVIEKTRISGESRTLLNRRRIIKGFESKNYATIENAKRLAINSPIQGSAADIIKIAMVDLYKSLNHESVWMLLQIHDELVFECDNMLVEETKQKIKDTMTNVIKLKVPLEVNISSGDNLAETKL